MKKIIVIGVIALFIVVGFQSAFATQPIKSTDITKEEIEPKHYLFETIIEIANNPDVKKLFEEYKHNIFDLVYGYNDIDKQILLNNPTLFLSLFFTKPEISSEYLNFAYDKGSGIVDIIGEDEALEIIESIEDSDFDILKDLNHIIMNNEEISNRFTILSELNENTVICFILWLMFLTFSVCTFIFTIIWNLNPNSAIWAIIFLPPALTCGILSLGIFWLYLNLGCMA